MKINWIGIGILALIMFSCENDLKEVQKIIDANQVNVETADNVRIYYSDSAKTKVYIEAPSMRNYLDIRNPRNEFDKGLKVDFYNNLEEVVGELTAKYAIQYKDKNDIIARDSVILKSKDGDWLETEELLFNEKTEKISSTKFVTIQRQGETIWGYGFESNPDFSEWKIFSPVGRIKTPENK